MISSWESKWLHGVENVVYTLLSLKIPQNNDMIPILWGIKWA